MFTTTSVHVYPDDDVHPNPTNTGISITSPDDADHQIDIFLGGSPAEMRRTGARLIDAIHLVLLDLPGEVVQ